MTPDEMAGAILDFEARRNSKGELVVYRLPSGDGGGSFEVAGICERWHPREARRLKNLIESGEHELAEREARKYIRSATDLPLFPLASAGIEFFLRDTAFNRGKTGAAKILQRALGVAVDGQIGPKTFAALHTKLDIDRKELLRALRMAREWWERSVVGQDESSKFWRGLLARWNAVTLLSERSL